MRNLKLYVICVVLFVIFGIAGAMDMEVQVNRGKSSSQLYCERVADGVHGNDAGIDCEVYRRG